MQSTSQPCLGMVIAVGIYVNFCSINSPLILCWVFLPVRCIDFNAVTLTLPVMSSVPCSRSGCDKTGRTNWTLARHPRSYNQSDTTSPGRRTTSYSQHWHQTCIGAAFIDFFCENLIERSGSTECEPSDSICSWGLGVLLSRRTSCPATSSLGDAVWSGLTHNTLHRVHRAAGFP